MTFDSEYEEKRKDDIIQLINDKLEKYHWGGKCKQMTLKVVFEGEFNVVGLFVNNNESDRKTKI